MNRIEITGHPIIPGSIVQFLLTVDLPFLPVVAVLICPWLFLSLVKWQKLLIITEQMCCPISLSSIVVTTELDCLTELDCHTPSSALFFLFLTL